MAGDNPLHLKRSKLHWENVALTYKVINLTYNTYQPSRHTSGPSFELPAEKFTNEPVNLLKIKLLYFDNPSTY